VERLTNEICNDMLTKGITFINKDLKFDEKIKIQRTLVSNFGINCTIIETPFKTIIKRV
jgi:hypothetical protein